MSDQLLEDIKAAETTLKQLTTKRSELDGRKQSLQEQRIQLFEQLQAHLPSKEGIQSTDISLTELDEYIAAEREKLKADIQQIRARLTELTNTINGN